jgi:GNAT superfamily N-acetyltransferase
MKLRELVEGVEFKNLKNEIDVKRADDKYIEIDMVHIGDIIINGKTAAIKQEVGRSNVRAARRSNGQWEVRNLYVDPKVRGTGIAEDLLKEIVKHVKGPVTTSGVHSPDGKRKLDAMVRRGQAIKDGDDYIIKG